MNNKADFIETINQSILSTWDNSLEPWKDLPGFSDLYDICLQALKGGKRTRGYLAFLAYQSCISIQDSSREKNLSSAKTVTSSAQVDPDSDIIKLACALETYQASALVHDDIIDNAPTRRGRPATHISFQNLHQDRAWQQDSQHFGISAGILAGDLLLSVADRLVPISKPRVWQSWAQMTQEVAIGQYLDMRQENFPHDYSDTTTPLLVMRHKSARYSVAYPLLLGAQLADAPEEIGKILFEVGENWGMAFQMCDDDLGIFGDPQLTGKPAGADLIEGKATLLLALAKNNLPETDWQIIANVLGKKTEAKAVKTAIDLLESSGIRQLHQSEWEKYYLTGKNLLDQIDLSASARQSLEELGRKLSQRES